MMTEPDAKGQAETSEGYSVWRVFLQSGKIYLDAGPREEVRRRWNEKTPADYVEKISAFYEQVDELKLPVFERMAPGRGRIEVFEREGAWGIREVWDCELPPEYKEGRFVFDATLSKAAAEAVLTLITEGLDDMVPADWDGVKSFLHRMGISDAAMIPPPWPQVRQAYHRAVERNSAQIAQRDQFHRQADTAATPGEKGKARRAAGELEYRIRESADEVHRLLLAQGGSNN